LLAPRTRLWILDLLMNITLGGAICLHCAASLVLPTQPRAEIECPRCTHKYMLIKGEIPLLLERGEEYAAGLAVQYDRYLREQQQEQQRWAEPDVAQGIRAQYLAALLVARAHNNQYLDNIRVALLGQVSKSALLRAATQPNLVRYATNWSYLRRDWCGLPEGEEELAIILATLTAVGAFDTTQTVLVAGAATARLAWLLRRCVRHVYAVDISLTMAWQFYDLLRNGQLPFYNIQTKNRRTAADGIAAHTATLFDLPTAGEEWGTFSYFVADACRMPLPDHSLDAVVAVYFTDTLPLRQLLPEMRRLLKPGGRYVHFGPLEYHFDDVAEMLTAEEVRQAFVAYGFCMEQECEVASRHLYSSQSLAHRTYLNWCFTALAPPLTSVFTQQAVLSIVEPLQYSTHGQLSDGLDEATETHLRNAAGAVYEGAGTVLDLLRCIDGRRTGEEVIAELAKQYTLDKVNDAPVLWELLKTLYKDNIIKVLSDGT